MISATFEALGKPKTRAKWGAALVLLKREVDKHMVDWADNVVAHVKEYPPVPADSDYERTETLYRSWKVRRPTYIGEMLSVRVYNDAVDPRGRKYATYVQGPWQVWYHERAGWKNIADYLDRPGYRRGLMSIYRAFARRVNA